MITAKEYADLCQAAYDGANGGLRGTDWSVGDAHDGWVVKQQVNTREGSEADGGFSAVIFQKGDQVVVVFKGTDFKTYGDAATDVDLAVGSKNPQYRALEKFLDDNRNLLRGGEVTFVGHSLGGNLAMHATMTSSVEARCVAFNAPGFSDEYVRSHPQFGSMGDKIIEYQNKRDFVSSIGHHPTRPLIVESGAGTLSTNHDLTDLAWRGGFPILADPQVKNVRCYVVEQVLDLADELVAENGSLHTLTKIVLRIVYADFEVDSYLGIAAVVATFVFLPRLAAVVLAVAALVCAVLLLDLCVEYWDEAVAALGSLASQIAGAVVYGLQSSYSEIKADWVRILSAAQDFIEDCRERLRQGLASIRNKLPGGTVHVLAPLAVNLDELRQLASRLRRIQSRVSSIDRRLNRLALMVEGIDKKVAVAGMDFLKVDSGRAIGECASYVEAAVMRLESAERRIAGAAAGFVG